MSSASSHSIILISFLWEVLLWTGFFPACSSWDMDLHNPQGSFCNVQIFIQPFFLLISAHKFFFLISFPGLCSFIKQDLFYYGTQLWVFSYWESKLFCCLKKKRKKESTNLFFFFCRRKWKTGKEIVLQELCRGSETGYHYRKYHFLVDLPNNY